METNQYKNEPPRQKFLCLHGRRPPISKHPDRLIYLNVPDNEIPSNKISTGKYTLYDFLPKNLLEQFSKPSNFYFLIIGLLQILPAISNSDNLPTIYLPLFVIIMISMVKDCFEDLKRHHSDNEENQRKVFCLGRDREFAPVSWEDVRVGNILKIMQGEYLPSDILLIDSSAEKGECFIETKNLDGETNLKFKCVHKNLMGRFKELDFGKTKTTFEFEKPNAFLYSFVGKITIEGDQTTSLDSQNFVLRGCSLQNTKWIMGVVAYSGHDSKIMLNSVKAKPKYSKVDRLMNKQIRFIFIVQNLVCLFCSLYGIIWYNRKKADLKYLVYQPNDLEESNMALAWARNYGVWILILTNFVPISLLVTLEMVKFIQGIFISKDKRLLSKGTGTEIFTEVHSSNLNEELGQINYIFSDKTGTLTKNIMEFKFLSVGEVSYGARRDLDLAEKGLKPMDKVDFLDKSLFEDLENTLSNHHKQVNEAILLLAVTHNIIIEEKEGEIIYNASSPDELSLVNFARFCGFMYKGVTSANEIIINQTKFKFLHFLEFTSARKRSSIILENESNQVILYCKGADSVIFERMVPSKYLNSLKNQLESYALVGLRTLVLAKRVIPRKDFESWNAKYYEASVSLTEREEKMRDLQDEIEKELELIGATAIEDKLQDNVGDTIATLKEAGIQIWVLTGDKIETAINIGFSCKLLNDSLEKLLIDGKTKTEITECLKQALHKVTEKASVESGSDLKSDFAMVLSGEALITITQDPEFCATMLMISDHCKAILACRVSPKQKGELVALVRKEKPDITTLAIGDGANDVNMITAAHVGVGIKGVEGQQAARASDYAIGEFQLLRRLLLYVGRESYRKNSSLICYNFYKNMVLVLPLFWYAFFNGFSGQILYDSMLYQLFNVFYCSLPIIIYALFDEQFPNNRILDVFQGPNNTLETVPKHYEVGLKSKLFNTGVFWYWILNGVFHSLILTGFTILITGGMFAVPDGKDQSLIEIGGNIYTGAVILSNLKILIFSYVYFPFSLFLLFASIFFYIFNDFLWSLISVTMDFYGSFGKCFGVGTFYTLIILLVGFTMLTDLAIFRMGEINGEGEFDEGSSISYEEEEGEENISGLEMIEFNKREESNGGERI